MSPAVPPNDPTKIYVLPNLMTAGNLIFGFLAVLKIFEGSIAQVKGGTDWMHPYVISIQCILVACLFDLLDGRLARLGGRESPFGREFDSLADLVSFGVAPALLLFKIVLYALPSRIGWLVAGCYLLCGAFRLARFNIAATYGLHSRGGRGHFLDHAFGPFPIRA
jgi:CDP-diacylglycerol--serine O-phosphatidyltransferase